MKIGITTLIGVTLMAWGMIWKVNNLYPTKISKVIQSDSIELIDTLQLGNFKFGNELKDSILLSINLTDYYERQESQPTDSVKVSSWSSENSDWMVNTTNGKVVSVVRIIDGKLIPDTFDEYFIKD